MTLGGTPAFFVFITALYYMNYLTLSKEKPASFAANTISFCNGFVGSFVAKATDSESGGANSDAIYSCQMVRQQFVVVCCVFRYTACRLDLK